MSVLIMKFGGASLATLESFPAIAKKIIDYKKEYDQVVAVVSAMGDATEKFIQLAKQVHPNPPRREMDMLLTVGERISMSLLAMALDLEGQKAVSLTGSQAGIITCHNHSEARILEVKPQRVKKHLERNEIVLVAGFQGVSREGDITTLGRGGSDTSAVALGVALGAEKVMFFKDVPGIYDNDPKKDSKAQFFPFLSYRDAYGIVARGAKVLHARSVLLAEKNEIPLHIVSFQPDSNSQGTLIGSLPRTQFSKPQYEEVEALHVTA